MSERKSDTGDDDLGLDESISSMRSMWREMRDEEPSDRGMAALLAAAREKAEEMKPKRSWFAVLLEQLRRPPVLAMATAVVLIGGAVVVSQRGDELKTESERASSAPVTRTDLGAASDRYDEPTPAPPSAAPTAPEAAKLDVSGEAAGAAPQESLSPPASRPRPQRAGPRANNVAGNNAPEKPEDRRTARASGSKPEPPPDPTPEPKKAEKNVSQEGAKLELATGDEEEMTPEGGMAPTTAASSDHKPVSRKPLPSIEGEDRASRDSTIAQLVKQCEAAAAKNDCAAVRTIAQKIAKQDPSAYRLKVTRNNAIARCLEPPAPIEAPASGVD